MMITDNSITIEQRFHVLRDVIQCYQARITAMEREVVELFAESRLEAIAEVINEKKQTELLIDKLQKFVLYWEAHADQTIDH